ncbi:hypothetical protein CYMTET_26158 [Cymbomonas tetramitiformis]|uniref:Uncharacterized protein n=1 Tax=Cymbomonas tetramitiformis TaxID=36881 RepID=A0AAE0FT23_9CHLO|nr:hypothetical protein CYMTET_26158 [Cymbomonas tetramitiformis]
MVVAWLLLACLVPYGVRYLGTAPPCSCRLLPSTGGALGRLWRARLTPCGVWAAQAAGALSNPGKPGSRDMRDAKMLYVTLKMDWTADPEVSGPEALKHMLGEGEGTAAWGDVDGLRHKYFLYQPETETVSGVYVFFSQEKLDAYMSSKLFTMQGEPRHVSKVTATVLDVMEGTECSIEMAEWGSARPSQEDVAQAAMLIVHLNVDYTAHQSLPHEQALRNVMRADGMGYPKAFRAVLGLRSKYFVYDSATETCSGFYTFLTRAALDAYVASDLFMAQSAFPYIDGMAYSIHEVWPGTERTMDLGAWTGQSSAWLGPVRQGAQLVMSTPAGQGGSVSAPRTETEVRVERKGDSKEKAALAQATERIKGLERELEASEDVARAMASLVAKEEPRCSATMKRGMAAVARTGELHERLAAAERRLQDAQQRLMEQRAATTAASEEQDSKLAQRDAEVRALTQRAEAAERHGAELEDEVDTLQEALERGSAAAVAAQEKIEGLEMESAGKEEVLQGVQQQAEEVCAEAAALREMCDAAQQEADRANEALRQAVAQLARLKEKSKAEKEEAQLKGVRDIYGNSGSRGK